MAKERSDVPVAVQEPVETTVLRPAKRGKPAQLELFRDGVYVSTTEIGPRGQPAS